MSPRPPCRPNRPRSDSPKKRLMGVYRILCVASGRSYIGSSIDIYARWKQHRSSLRQRCHFNRTLQADWDRYGEPAFEFEILEELAAGCDLVSTENQWISELNPAHNRRPLGRKAPRQPLSGFGGIDATRNLMEDTRDAAPVPILDRA